jgi:hypothetical protein
MLLEAVGLIVAVDARRLAQCAIEICAAFASASTDWVAAGRLFGAAAEQARRMGMQPDPADEASLALWRSQARAALGDEFARYGTEAGRWTLDQGLAEAREWLLGSSRTRQAVPTT